MDIPPCQRRMGDVRIEADTMGELEVPADRYYGCQTARSLINFDIGEDTMPRGVVRAFGILKQAAARTNVALGQLDASVGDLVAAAAQEVIDGQLDDHFPLRVWQTGSGTQSNMNANEVIANRAIEMAGGVLGSKSPVHPNDHVNRGNPPTTPSPPRCTSPGLKPSSTRSFLPSTPCAMRWRPRPRPGRASSRSAGPTSWTPCRSPSDRKPAAGWPNWTRTCAVFFAVEDLHELALGGTAVGTGLNTHPDFAERVAAAIAETTGLPFVSAPNKFAQLAAHDAVVAASGAFNTLAAC